MNHLVRSKHKEVTLHTDGVLGETTLECYNCGSKNIFLLGFIPAAREGVVVLLCREPCLNNNALRDSDFDLQDWQPLIENRALVSWLVGVPGEEYVKGARQCTAQQINKIEEIWKTNPSASMEDLNRPGVDAELTPVSLKYEDAYQYQNVFAPLVKIEADYDRKVKESQRQESVLIRWDIGLNKKRLAYFVFAKEDNESRVVVGDELRLKYQYETRYTPEGSKLIWEATGQVVRLTQTEEVCLELRLPATQIVSILNKMDFFQQGPWDEHLTSGFIVEFVWKATSFERMQKAMVQLAHNDNALSSHLYHKLMGHDVEEHMFKSFMPKSCSAPNLAQLNHSQIAAVRKALQSPLCLIQGPPGTGKTVTSATIVYHLVQINKHNQNSDDNETRREGGKGFNKAGRHASKHQMTSKVLVVAPSNVAVDQLAEKIHQTGR